MDTYLITMSMVIITGLTCLAYVTTPPATYTCDREQIILEELTLTMEQLNRKRVPKPEMKPVR